MNSFGLWKQHPPREVIQAACDFYGVSPKQASTIQAEKLKVLSDNLWLVNLNKKSPVIVAYTPGTNAIAAPWYE